MTPSLASNDFHGSKHPNGQGKTAEAAVVKQQNFRIRFPPAESLLRFLARCDCVGSTRADRALFDPRSPPRPG